MKDSARKPSFVVRFMETLALELETVMAYVGFAEDVLWRGGVGKHKNQTKRAGKSEACRADQLNTMFPSF